MYTEDQAAVQNDWANQLFGSTSATCSAMNYTMLTTACACPTTVSAPYSGSDNICEVEGTFLLPNTYTGLSIDFENAATYTWSTGGYLPGGTAITGSSYTLTAPPTCAPEDVVLYLNVSCSSDPTVQLNAGTHTLTVSPDPTRFAVADLVTFTDGDCNGPTYVITSGCESYVTVTPNGAPTFPVAMGSSGSVNYDVVLDYGTACLPIELVGIIGSTTLNGSNDASGDGTATCVNETNPTVDEIAFTIPPAMNATDVNLSGVGSIVEVCIDLTVANSDVIVVSLDSPNCGGYTWENLWTGNAFNGGSNTGSTNLCFTADMPNGEFDGDFDGDDGGAGFDNCLINGNTWVLYVANYGCYAGISSDGTLNNASITFNDGQQVDAPVSLTAMANYNCSGTMAMITDPCTCMDNESAPNAGDGQLSEVVQIQSAGPGERWYIMAVAENGGANAGGGLYDPASAAPPAAPTNFTIGPAGTILVNGLTDGIDNDMDTMVDEADEDIYYTLQGVHVDGLGYEIILTTDGTTTLSINNTCYYPDINSSIAASYCDTNADVDLTTLVSGLLGSSGAATTGIFSFEVFDSGNASVSTSSTLSPSTLGAGNYTIEVTFDETDAATGAIDPGCVTTISAALTITACGCPADNGTLISNN